MPIPNENNSIVSDATYLSELFSVIRRELDQVLEYICNQLVTPNESVNALLRYITDLRGKMLRPGLVLLSGQSCGRIDKLHIEIASISEMIHAASLLHDDVIDEAENRRGSATVNSARGNATAVLLGDFLLSKVFSIASGFDIPRIAVELSATTVELCRGELLQNTQKQNYQLDKETYLDIVHGKTAVLFGSCCFLGALASSAEDKTADNLRKYGSNLGLAFQITDDLLDIIGDEDQLGKTLGTDIQKRKLTLPLIHLMDKLEDNEKDSIAAELNSKDKSSYLIELLQKHGSIEYTKEQVQLYCHKAIDSIRDLSESPARDKLVDIVRFVANRCP